METSQQPLSIDKLPGKDNQKIKRYTFMGFHVYVGMNALSNEKLITEHEHKGCLWLHAFGASGAHVILCANGTGDVFDLPSKRYAASLALKFSDRSSKTISVAPLEDVYKPQHSRVGVFRTWRQETISIQ
jgi:predicted ribosome quality control (RQC) complex YloA/Tae2 family protein